MLWYFQLKVCFQQIGDQSLLEPRHGIKLGINRMFLKGDLLIRLEPLIDEIPVIGGIVPCQMSSRFSRLLLAILRAAPAIQWDSAVVIPPCSVLVKVVCFLNQPEVEFQYSGLAARQGLTSIYAAVGSLSNE